MFTDCPKRLHKTNAVYSRIDKLCSIKLLKRCLVAVQVILYHSCDAFSATYAAYSAETILNSGVALLVKLCDDTISKLPLTAFFCMLFCNNDKNNHITTYWTSYKPILHIYNISRKGQDCQLILNEQLIGSSCMHVLYISVHTDSNAYKYIVFSNKWPGKYKLTQHW